MDAGADVNANTADTEAADADAVEADADAAEADADAADIDSADDAEKEAGGRPMVKGVDGEAEAPVLNRDVAPDADRRRSSD